MFFRIKTKILQRKTLLIKILGVPFLENNILFRIIKHGCTQTVFSLFIH